MPDTRVRLGQEKVGLPMMQTYEALGYTVEGKGWKRFNQQPIYFYFDRMLGQWLIDTIDASLDDEQLGKLDPDESRIISLLLIRDMLRHNREIVWNGKGQWIGPFINEIGKHLDLPSDRLADDGQAYDLQEQSNGDWAKRLALPFGIPAMKLFESHRNNVAEVAKKFKVVKAWWQVW